MLGGKQALQGEGLLHAQRGELVAGLGRFQRADGIARAGQGVGEEACVDVEPVGDLALQEGGAAEGGVLLVPAGLGVAERLVMR